MLAHLKIMLFMFRFCIQHYIYCGPPGGLRGQQVHGEVGVEVTFLTVDMASKKILIFGGLFLVALASVRRWAEVV